MHRIARGALALVAGFIPIVAQAANWLQPWSHRRSITVSNSSSTRLDAHAVKVTIAAASQMQTSYADIRFTDSDGVTLLPQWRERNDSTQAVFWVRVPRIPAASGGTPGTASLYLYYGNSSAANTSDGHATFDFFEDFSSSDGVAKSEANPLFTGAQEPSIVKAGSEYWIYYDGNGKIYRRVSTDGMTWGPAVETGIGGRYVHVYRDYDQTTYRMIYNSGDLKEIRLATSTDGRNFTNRGVLLTPSSGAWDSVYLFDPCEIKVGGKYYLFYGGRATEADGTGEIGVAISLTGQPGSHTKQGRVLQPSGTEINATAVFDAEVLEYDIGKYIMFYTGYNSSTAKQVATYATSTDLLQWTISGQSLYWNSQTWETATYGPNEPTVLIENGRYTVWYRGDTGGCQPPCVSPGSVGRLTLPRDPATKEPAPESQWLRSPNTTLTVTNGAATVATSSQSQFLHSKSYRTTDGVIEAQMSIASTYPNANLSGRIDAANTLDVATGPAGSNNTLYLFEHTPSFASRGSTAFTHGTGANIYQLELAGSSLFAKSWNAASAEPVSSMVAGTATRVQSGAVGLYLNSSTAVVDWLRVRKRGGPVTVTVGAVEP